MHSHIYSICFSKLNLCVCRCVCNVYYSIFVCFNHSCVLSKTIGYIKNCVIEQTEKISGSNWIQLIYYAMSTLAHKGNLNPLPYRQHVALAIQLKVLYINSCWNWTLTTEHPITSNLCQYQQKHNTTLFTFCDVTTSVCSNCFWVKPEQLSGQ